MPTEPPSKYLPSKQQKISKLANILGSIRYSPISNQKNVYLANIVSSILIFNLLVNADVSIMNRKIPKEAINMKNE